MQKWSPEPFDDERPGSVATASAVPEFEAVPTADGFDPRAGLFRRDSGFSDNKTLMGSLTPDERAQVYELVAIDLESEYKAREEKLTAAFEVRLANARDEMTAHFDGCAAAITDAAADQLREAAAACARLSVEIAGKIIRSTVAVDPAVISRVIETTLFKLTTSQPLTVFANPAEIAWLEGQPNLCARLNIGRVVGDRRIEPGGCLVQSEGREWDATLARQLGTIGEIIEETIASEAGRPANPEGEAAPPVAGTAESPSWARPAAGFPEGGDEPGMD